MNQSFWLAVLSAPQDEADAMLEMLKDHEASKREREKLEIKNRIREEASR